MRDNTIKNPSYGNGILKVEPYDFYDYGILVFSARGGAKVTVKTKVGEKIKESDVDTYVVNTVPFSRMRLFNEGGDGNYPYPTIFCRFKNGNPYEEEWYIDKKTGIRYTDEQIINKEFDRKAYSLHIDYLK